MYGLLTSLSLLASAAVGALAADLKIDVTLPVECDRPTKANDKIYVHYRGTLQSNGNKFDASTLPTTPSNIEEELSFHQFANSCGCHLQATIEAHLSPSSWVPAR